MNFEDLNPLMMRHIIKEEGEIDFLQIENLDQCFWALDCVPHKYFHLHSGNGKYECMMGIERRAEVGSGWCKTPNEAIVRAMLLLVRSK